MNSVKSLVFSATAILLVIGGGPAQTQGGNGPRAQAKQESQIPEGKRYRLRFIDNTIRDGFILKWDDKGILFKPVEKELPAVRFLWEELHPEDSLALRTLLRGEEEDGPVPPQVLVKGMRLTLKDNQIVEGVFDQATSDAVSYRIRMLKGYRVVLREQIVREEKIDLRLNQVFTPEEIYSMVLDRIKPATPEDYAKFASELVAVGLPDRAFDAFRISLILRRPELPEGKLYKDLLKLMRLLETTRLKEILYQAQGHYIRRELDQVIAMIDHLDQELAKQEKMKEVLDELRRLRTEVQVMRQMSRDEQIVAEGYRTIESLLLSKALDRNLGYHDAVRYVEGQMPRDVHKIVSASFHIHPDDPSFKTIWDRRPRNVHLKTSYDESTWLVTRPEEADRETWWARANHGVRYKFLKGLYAEKYMYVIQILDKNCSQCGGTGGVVSERSPTSGECPSCLGLKKHRVVIYR